MFNKQEYWARRKNKIKTKTESGLEYEIDMPLRGQTDDIKPKLIETGNVFNRRFRRQRIINRKFTKKGYEYGLKINGRQYNKIHHLAKIQAEK